MESHRILKKNLLIFEYIFVLNFSKVKTKYGADGLKNPEFIRGKVRLLGIPEYLVFFLCPFFREKTPVGGIFCESTR